MDSMLTVVSIFALLLGVLALAAAMPLTGGFLVLVGACGLISARYSPDEPDTTNE